jgi:hypothetical protein
MLLWRLWSIILKIEAPRPAADVRKPDRSEWPAKSLGCLASRRLRCWAASRAQAISFHVGACTCHRVVQPVAKPPYCM